MDQKSKMDQYVGCLAEAVKGSTDAEIEQRLCKSQA
jgi:hypothetical protein